LSALNVQAVTFFPVPPVKPIVYPRPDAPVDEKQPVQRAASNGSVGATGRIFDFKV
jgi:hypothetical protein